MTDAETYLDLVRGKTLTNLFFTEQDGPHDYCPGIPPAYYFSTVLELDNQQKLAFYDDSIFEWKAAETLIRLTNEAWNLPATLVFRGQPIVDLTRDEEGHLTFHLENGVTIAHTTDYGDKLWIRPPG